MADRRAAAITRLATRLGEHAASAATYRRGPHSAEITATITDPSSTSRLGPLATAAGLDLSGLAAVFPAAELVLDGAQATPKLGDEIDVELGGVEHSFAVSQEAGQDVFRYADPNRTLIRVRLTHLGVPT